MMKTKFLIFFLIISGATVSCQGQDFTYKKMDNRYEKFIKPQNLNDYVTVKDYLPKGFVKDGSEDYTTYIQKAIYENKNIAFPNFPIQVNSKGLKLRDSSNVFFDRKSKLVLRPTRKKRYKILFLPNVKNVNIYNSHLIGDRKEHKGDAGQWGMGIRIHDSENVNIYNPTIKNTWGDGIYITSYTKEKANNINIKYGLIDNARRNGISIISGRNITIDSVQISNTNGHNPASGIDVEPNKTKNAIENLALKNIFTFNNAKDGIVVSLSNLVSQKNINKKVTLSILNHKDTGSRTGLFIANIRNRKKLDKQMKGIIKVRNAEWINTKSKHALNIGENIDLLPKIILENIHTNNMSQKDLKKHFKKLIHDNKKLQFK